MNNQMKRLKQLVIELQALPGWPETELPAGLLLYDVLAALGAPAAMMELILGREVLDRVQGLASQGAESTPPTRL